MYCSLLLLACGGAVSAGPPGGHGFHVPMPDQELYVVGQCAGESAAGSTERVLERPMSMAPADLDLALELPCVDGALRVTKYLPQAKREQEVKPVEEAEAAPAIKLHIEGRKQQVDRWLVAGDSERNRLTSLIGTWRFMAVTSRDERDALFKAFEGELTRPPTIELIADEEKAPVTIPARPGEEASLGDGKARVRMLKFLSHFGIDRKTKEPVNQSDDLMNPAALVRVTQGDSSEEKWLFAKFPGFSAHGEAGSSMHMRLDCPVGKQDTAPDFALVTIERRRIEVWTRHDGKTVSQSVTTGQHVAIGQSAYAFWVGKFVPSGRLVETYRPTDDRAAVTAVKVELPDASGTVADVWLELARPRTVQIPGGRVILTFASRAAGSKGGAEWHHE
jgi:hypothetical protein